MKILSIEDFKFQIDEHLRSLDRETLILTRDGRPCAVLHGVPEDLETAELLHSADFWRVIEERRHEPAIPWDEAKRQLG